ncbi:hypothetical protein JXR93_14555 [bacterium]|nr:hypothetical protein [bacterium]
MKGIIIFLNLWIFFATHIIFNSLVDINEKNVNKNLFSFILTIVFMFILLISVKGFKFIKNRSKKIYIISIFLGILINVIFHRIAEIEVIQSFFTQWIPFLILTAVFSIVSFIGIQVLIKIGFEEKKLLISEKILIAYSSLYIVMYLILLLFYFLKVQIEDPMRYGIAGLLAIIGVILSFFIEDKEKMKNSKRLKYREKRESN